MTERHRIRLSKFIDEYVGRGLIALCRRVSSPAARTVLHPVGKILFVKFWGIGSVVLTEPALRWLARSYPGVEIHYLTFSRNAQVVRLIPQVSRIHALPFRSFASFAAGCTGLLLRLRRERYDLILDGEFFCHFSGLLSYLASPGGRIVGFGRPGSPKSRLQTVSLPFHPDRHVARQFLALARTGTSATSGLEGFQTRPSLRLESGSTGPPGPGGARPYAVLNVNASPLARERRWPRRGFIQLGRSLLAKHAFDLVLVGTARERPYVERVEAELNSPDRVHNLCGLTDLPQLASLLRDAAMVISNDSGPVHLASSLDVPVVAFYGPETPALYGPLSSRKLVFYEGLWCSPCMSVENAKTVNCINHRACMREIDPARVIHLVHRFIETDVFPTGSAACRRAPKETAPIMI